MNEINNKCKLLFLSLIVRLNLVIPNFNPVMTRDRVSERGNNSGNGRPVPRTIRTVYEYNPRCAKLENWHHESLTYNQLVNDSVPLNAAVIVSATAGDITTEEEDNAMGD